MRRANPLAEIRGLLTRTVKSAGRTRAPGGGVKWLNACSGGQAVAVPAGDGVCCMAWRVNYFVVPVRVHCTLHRSRRWRIVWRRGHCSGGTGPCGSTRRGSGLLRRPALRGLARGWAGRGALAHRCFSRRVAAWRTSERKDRPEPGGNSGRLETAPAVRRRRAVGGDGMGSHDSTHCTTWRAIHRAHQAAAMEMVTGEIMRRTVLARAGQDGAPASAWRSSRRDAARCARWGL